MDPLQLISKKKRTYHGFCDYIVKIKESGKIDDYLDFAREQKLRNMMLIVVPTAVYSLRTVQKDLEKDWKNVKLEGNS